MPLGDGVIPEGIPIVRGGVVGRVGVPKVDMEEPRVGPSSAFEPVEDPGIISSARSVPNPRTRFIDSKKPDVHHGALCRSGKLENEAV